MQSLTKFTLSLRRFPSSSPSRRSFTTLLYAEDGRWVEEATTSSVFTTRSSASFPSAITTASAPLDTMLSSEAKQRLCHADFDGHDVTEQVMSVANGAAFLHDWSSWSSSTSSSSSAYEDA